MKPRHRAIGAAFAAMAALVLSCGSAPAQLQPPLRLPGTIEKVDGDTIWIRPYEGGGFFEIVLDKKLVVFGVTPGTPYADIRKRYRSLVAENHPDKAMARGLPAEFIAIANRRMAAINVAFSSIERALKPA